MASVGMLTLEPVVGWPREMAPGRPYLVTVDLRLAEAAGDWPHDREELPFTCVLEGPAAFTVEAVHDASVVLHRFGGSYGPAEFIVTPHAEPGRRSLWLTILTERGVEVRRIELPVEVGDDSVEAAATTTRPVRTAAPAAAPAEPPTPPATRAVTRVMVDVEPVAGGPGDRYLLRVLKIGPDGAFAGSAVDRSGPLTVDELQARFAFAFRYLVSDPHGRDDLWVEFVLPEELLGLPVDQWLVDRPGSAPVPVGTVLPAVVRSRETALSLGQQARWQRRSRILRRQEDHGEQGRIFWVPREVHGSRLLYSNLLQADYVCAVFERAPYLSLYALRSAGVPVAVWCRTPGFAEELSARLRWNLADEPVSDLPYLVLRLRREAAAAAAPARHFGSHITLLWDDAGDEPSVAEPEAVPEEGDGPARLESLLATPGVHLIVDGDNVARQGVPFDTDRRDRLIADRRNRLVSGLGEIAARTGAEITCVFDEPVPRESIPSPLPRGVRVLLPQGLGVVNFIRQLARAETGRPVAVVSSDRDLAHLVEQAGVHLLAADALSQVLNSERRSDQAPSGRCAIFACDIASFGDPARDDRVREYLRVALHERLRRSFDASGVPFDGCHHEDRGDGVIIVPPPDLDPAMFHPIVDRLNGELRRHNEMTGQVTQLRLRVSMHIGEVATDPHGIVGTAVIHAARLLDAPHFKNALNSSHAHLGFIVSAGVYETVIRRGGELLEPDEYAPIEVQMKETNTTAWVRIFGVGGDSIHREPELVGAGIVPSAGPQSGPWDVQSLFEVVDGLLALPIMAISEGRDQVVSSLPSDVAMRISRHSTANSDTYSILRTCLDSPGGLQDLLTILRAFSGDSAPMHALEATIETLAAGPEDRP
ncbi:NYN domain-containing protein [Actinomadura sp. HBU206391]|uniref:NYN domain-containing protein n=1 Tax=Actinomadura sp. HBU206391 TaxID=2731692 RepID=UPI00164F4E6E|nr:NYN domain-containing protein [Actinomadura sp. HBU206391]MBC6461077.1 NYN domain-containing protein [Actinomadura sp. HBU206391]